MPDVSAVSGSSYDYAWTGENYTEAQRDAAREKFLRDRLHDNSHPLSNAEWNAIQRELHDLKAKRETRAYDATKIAGAHDASQPEATPATLPVLPGGGGLSMLLALQTGMLHSPRTLAEPPSAPSAMTEK